MVPSFGFSVGDFIAAIGLCTKVAKALKSSSGVKSEYQQVVIEIEGLQGALTRLAALEPTESNIDHVNAIRRMALACSLPMQDFLFKLEKYEAAMSPFATAKSAASAGKKADYAVFMSEEVKTMRAMISGKVISINLLLGTHASETLSRTEGQLSTNQADLLARLEQAKDDMSSVRGDITNMNTAVRDSQEQLRKETIASASQISERLNQISTDTVSTKRSMSAVASGVSSISTSISTLCGLGTQVLAILSAFPSELRGLLQTVVRTNMQMYTVLLEVQRRISASPTLALDTNIRIEDALGQIRSLPYEWFQHWEPLEGLLRAEFKTRLGAERVENGEFRLVHAKRPTISMDKTNWSQTITAGADILMLMLITDLACRESSCPRQSCNGRTALQAERHAMLTCPECGLRFIPQLMLPEGTEAEVIEQLQLEEDARLFGTRSQPGIQSSGKVEMADIPDPSEIDGPHHDYRLTTRGKPSTRYRSMPNVPQNHETSKRSASSENADSPIEPPIFSWLANTEPPEDPSSVLTWREEEENRRAKRQKKNAEDLEVFRNVEVVMPLKDDIPICDVQEPPHTPYNGYKFGARVFHRKILDQYPDLIDALAWRFANGNWKRLESLQEKEHQYQTSVQDPTDAHDGLTSSSSAYSFSSRDRDALKKLFLEPSKVRGFSRASYICSLPPPPRLARKRHSTLVYYYSGKCHLCHQKVRLRSKRHWSNHVMDDLLPYMCHVRDCLTPNNTFSRRRILHKHLQSDHPLEPCSQCFFCGCEMQPDSFLKHICHHMEEIAFGVLTTAYEEWSYDGTDSSQESIDLKDLVNSPREPQNTGPGPFVCTVSGCGRLIRRSNHLPMHIRRFHASPLGRDLLSTNSGPVREIDCDPCFELVMRCDRRKPCECCQVLKREQNCVYSSGEAITNSIHFDGAPVTHPCDGDSKDMWFGADVSRYEDNYWTRNSHPSSSASSVNSQLRHSVSDLM